MLRLRHQAVRYSNIPAAPTRKRFYKEVSIEHVKNDEAKSSCYRIKLDNRNLKTVGGGQVFEVPSKVLALGVQAEWSQQNNHINRSCMPLTNLTGLCQDFDPKAKTRESVIGELLKFLKSDTLLYRAFDSDELSELEESKWGPTTETLCRLLDIEMTTTNSFAPPGVNDEAVERVRNYLETFDMWALLSMEQLTSSLKSTILPLLLSMREITAKEAVDLSLVELDFQTGRWGKVEWHHDVEREDMYAKVAAATMVIHHSGRSEEIYTLSPLERLKMVADELEGNMLAQN